MVTLNEIKLSIEQMPIDQITPIVRKSVGDESAVVDPGWVVQSLTVDSIGTGTLGFLKVVGQVASSNGTTSWSCVIKVLDLNPELSFDSAIGSFISAERELNAYSSGYFDELKSGLRAAPCYGVSRSSGATLIWLEDLSDSVQHPWGRDEYLIAVRNIGFFNGTWPESRSPDGDWLDRKYAGTRPIANLKGEWLDKIVHPSNKRIVDDLAGRSGVAGIEKALAGYVDISKSLTRLPRVVNHNDLHARNAFFRYESEGPITYAIDWSSIGLGPAGLDGGTLAGGGIIWGQTEAHLIAEIESMMYSEYLVGLRDAGYKYKQTEVRLGYLSNFMFYVRGYAGAFIGGKDSLVTTVFSRRFGLEGEDFKDEIASRFRIFMPLFEEAVSLARQLG